MASNYSIFLNRMKYVLSVRQKITPSIAREGDSTCGGQGGGCGGKGGGWGGVTCDACGPCTGRLNV